MTQDAERARRADLWRAGLLDAVEARRFEQDMRADPELARQARFGARTAQALSELPRLAARRATRRTPRRARWARLAVAGVLSAGLAGLVAVGLGVLPPSQQSQAVPENAQTADAVQNMDFYEWLAAHPHAGDAQGESDAG